LTGPKLVEQLEQIRDSADFKMEWRKGAPG
jgi:hypothetical protein